MAELEIQYATSADGTNIAYQVVGSGPVDLLHVPPGASHLDLRWDEPRYARLLRRIASFSRFITLDKRGSGLSDRTEPPTPEQQVDDVAAVLDVVGSDRTYLWGSLDGVTSCLLFAAAYPDRVAGIVAYAPFARLRWAEDFPIGVPDEAVDAMLELAASLFGRPEALARTAPSVAHDEAYGRWWARSQRSASTPTAYVKFLRNHANTDIRDVVGSVQVPVLVLHRENDPWIPVDLGRDMAARLPTATLVELPGVDYFPWLDGVDAFVDAIARFVGGGHVAFDIDVDRVLATVLFTDIVDSTRRASELGDRRWRTLLDEHDDIVRSEVDRHHGRVVKTTGDGALATFDGPARAVRCATAVRHALQPIDLDIRAGIHTGEVERRGDDVGGIAVHIAARVQALARPGEVVVSRTVTDLVAGSGLAFESAGEHELKGVPGRWEVFAVR